MRTVKQIRDDLSSCSVILEMMETMRVVSAERYAKARMAKVERDARVAEALGGSFDLLASWGVDHPWLRPGAGSRAVLAVTSDAGFVGPTNAMVVRAALAAGGEGARHASVGEKGGGMLPGADPVVPFPDESAAELVLEAAWSWVVGCFASASEVWLVHARSPSMGSCVAEAERLFPLSLERWGSSLPAGSSPAASGWLARARGLVVESDPGRLLEFLAGFWLGWRVGGALEEAKIAEYGARVLHADGAARSLSEREEGLTDALNKARREAVDKQLREISSARKVAERKREARRRREVSRDVASNHVSEAHP